MSRTTAAEFPLLRWSFGRCAGSSGISFLKTMVELLDSGRDVFFSLCCDASLHGNECGLVDPADALFDTIDLISDSVGCPRNILADFHSPRKKSFFAIPCQLFSSAGFQCICFVACPTAFDAFGVAFFGFLCSCCRVSLGLTLDLTLARFSRTRLILWRKSFHSSSDSNPCNLSSW